MLLFITTFTQLISLCFSIESLPSEQLIKKIGNIGKPYSIEKSSSYPTVQNSIGPWGTRATDLKNRQTKKRHLILMGGSNTFGEHLNDEETITAILEKSLPSYQIYNLAYHGWGPAHILSLLEHSTIAKQVVPKKGIAVFFLHHYHLDRVVANTLYFNWSEGHGPKYDQNLQFRGLFYQQPDFHTKFILNLAKLFHFLEINRRYPPFSKDDASLTIRLIKAIKKHFPDTVAILPPSNWWHKSVTKKYNSLIDAAKRHKLQIISLHDGQKYELTHFDDGHLNALGAKYIAAEITRYVASRKSLDMP